jgi:hypothetical protein
MSGAPSPRPRLARVERRPLPSDWPSDAALTLPEAVAVFSLDYPITVSSLRTEIAAGRLTPSRVAGTFYITPAQIKALFTCPALPKVRDSTSDKGSAPRRSTSSETDIGRSALAAALIASQKRKERYKRTSPAGGKPPAGSVIPLRSQSPTS